MGQNYLSDYGETLIRHGYNIVPIAKGRQYPYGLDDWVNCKAGRDDVDKWVKQGYPGVGVLTKQNPAVDIDIRDPVVSQKVIDWCMVNIGNAPVRIGEAPKALLVYRCDTPFSKLRSREYQSPDGKKHQIEILGAGMQFVAYAIHPGTGKPYYYMDCLETPMVVTPGEQGLAGWNHRNLATITKGQAQELIDCFEREMIPDDWVMKGGKTQSSAIVSTGEPGDDITAAAFANHSVGVDLTDVEIVRILEQLNPDVLDYDDWLSVGMGLYHQYEGSKKGYDLWENWSKESTKYTSGYAVGKYKSFKADLQKKAITFRTIIDLLNNQKSNDVHRELHTALALQSMIPKKEIDAVSMFLKRYVFIESGSLVFDLKLNPHVALIPLNEFKAAQLNKRISMPAANPPASDPEREVVKPVADMWQMSGDRITVRYDGYLPNGGLIYKFKGVKRINTFFFPGQNTRGKFDWNVDLGVFFDHMRYMLPIKEEREWFIQWMAYNIQYPDQRCQVTPLHISRAHGTGRGWLAKLMEALLGDWNCATTEIKDLSRENGDFNGQFLDRKILVTIHEVKQRGNRFTVDSDIRSVLTDSPLDVNVKFGPKGSQPVYVNFLMFSNHLDALVIGEQDRRIQVLTGPKKAKDNQYYTRLYDWLKSNIDGEGCPRRGGGVATLFKYLRDCVDLSDFNDQRSTNTIGRRVMIASTKTDTEVWVESFLESTPFTVLTMQDIKDSIFKMIGVNEFSQGVSLNDKYVAHILRDHGAVKMNRVRINNERVYPWILNGDADMSDLKMKREYMKYLDSIKL